MFYARVKTRAKANISSASKPWLTVPLCVWAIFQVLTVFMPLYPIIRRIFIPRLPCIQYSGIYCFLLGNGLSHLLIVKQQEYITTCAPCCNELGHHSQRNLKHAKYINHAVSCCWSTRMSLTTSRNTYEVCFRSSLGSVALISLCT